MIELIQKIQTTLQAAESQFTEVDLPPIAFIDKFRGQPTSTEFTYSTPALFLESKTTWDKVGKAYNGKRQINFHIVTDADLGIVNTPPTVEEKFASEAYYTILRNLFDDLDTDNTGKLKRLEEKAADTALINYQVISYECVYADPFIAGLNIREEIEDETRSLSIETVDSFNKAHGLRQTSLQRDL